MKTALRRLGPYALLVFFLASAGALFWNRNTMFDWWVLRDYKTPSVIASLSTDTGMTAYGQRLFYVNEPTLDDKAVFNSHCGDLNEETAVLGCYRGDRQGIHIYDVTDERLHGVEQVTAAHEMLHQAYDRLSGGERARIDALLEDYYVNELTDQSIKDKMEIYKQLEPGQLANEMHSIFGTEVATLPAELETYYQKYFTDRQKVVAFRNQSKSAFDSYMQQIADIDAQLVALKEQIETNKQKLENDLEVIQDKKSDMAQDIAAGRIAEHNAQVETYNELVREYKQSVESANQTIHQYNALVGQRNDIAIQATELDQALDSRVDE